MLVEDLKRGLDTIDGECFAKFVVEYYRQRFHEVALADYLQGHNTCSSALHAAFTWSEAVTGREYWAKAHDTLFNGAVVSLKGECVPHYEVRRVDGNLRIGCQILTPDHQRKLHALLGKELGLE